jgi:hypothetical protein
MARRAPRRREVAHLGGGRQRTEEPTGGAPDGGWRGTDPDGGLDRWTEWGQGGEKTRGREILSKRGGGFVFWGISFRVYSPRSSNARCGNTVENASRLSGLLRFWAKT